MAKLWLDHMDGRYYVRLLTDEEAADHEARGFDVVYLEDSAYAAYVRHCDRDATWQVLWRSISNEQSMRRREKELMPLEDAAREIRRLKSELQNAQRSAKFFEDEWSQAVRALRMAQHESLTIKDLGTPIATAVETIAGDEDDEAW